MCAHLFHTLAKHTVPQWVYTPALVTNPGFSMPEYDPENLITISDAAEKVGCSRTTVYRALEDGRLHGVEVGGRQMVVRDEAFSAFEPKYTGFRREKYEEDDSSNSE